MIGSIEVVRVGGVGGGVVVVKLAVVDAEMARLGKRHEGWR